MTSDRIFAGLAAYLEPRVKAAGGVFSPSDTVDATLGLLAQAPTSWRCILQWQREDDTPNRNEMRARFLLIIQQGKGLSVNTADGLTLFGASAPQPPLLQRFNTAAAWLRAVVFANTDVRQQPIKQINAQWLNDPTFPTRQISGEFEIFYALQPVPLAPLTIA